MAVLASGCLWLGSGSKPSKLRHLNSSSIRLIHHFNGHKSWTFRNSKIKGRIVEAILMDNDQEKEESRQYRRTVFNHDRWASHRSTTRYWRHLDGVLTSRIVRGLFSPLLYVASISMAVTIYQILLTNGTLSSIADIEWMRMTVTPMGPFSISTFALSLLLVFRTNSSYDRWVEARRIWGNVVNRCRDLTRQAVLWFPQHAQHERDAFVVWVTIFPIVLMCHLRNAQSIEDELEQRQITLNNPNHLAALLQAPHKPVHVIAAMSRCVQKGDVGAVHTIRIDEGLSALHDAVGGCERIFNTPIPLSWSRHTSRFLVVWLTCMPFCIYEQLGLATTPVALLMSFLLLGIDEIGVQLEEPFSIMALENLCDGVNKTVRQTVQDMESIDSYDYSGGSSSSSVVVNENGNKK